VFNNIKITLHYNVYMCISGEKVHISDGAERVQSVIFSYKIIVRVIYSGVFKGRQGGPPQGISQINIPHF